MAELDTLGAVIKSTYEGEADTNAFTDDEKTKLAGVSENALNQSQVDARVVAVASGDNRIFLPVEELITPSSSAAGALATSNPGGSSKAILNYRPYDATTFERLWFVLYLPPKWDGGTVQVRFHWLNLASTNTGNVLWGVAARMLVDGSSLDQFTGATATALDAGPGTANLLNVSGWATMTVGAPAAGAIMFGQINRDGGDVSDTFTADAGLVGVEIEFVSDQPTDD